MSHPICVSVELDYWVGANGRVCKHGCVVVGVYGGEEKRGSESDCERVGESSCEMGITSSVCNHARQAGKD